MWDIATKWLRAINPWRERSLGEQGEDLAVSWLKRLGYTIIERQARSKLGELDIVALDETEPPRRVLVFVEVRTKSDATHGHPAETVDVEKQRRLTRLAVAYLKRHRLLGRPARFDVIGIIWHQDAPPQIDHIRDAFEAVGFDGMYS
ncbi:MAG: YraN family protein [Planctomycetaceae bacterium]|nr:YraN family protein [Planctomycetaceae bacterium]